MPNNDEWYSDTTHGNQTKRNERKPQASSATGDDGSCDEGDEAETQERSHYKSSNTPNSLQRDDGKPDGVSRHVVIVKWK